MSQSAVGTQLINMMSAQGPQASGMARQLQKLEDSCKDFESVFTTKLLEVMRKTVSTKDGLINGGRAEEIFTGLMDQEIAKNIADTGQMGLATMMFTQLKQQLFGNAQITDPKFFELGRELIKIEAENSDMTAGDDAAVMLEAGEGEGEKDLAAMLVEAGVDAEDAAADADGVVADGQTDIPVQGVEQAVPVTEVPVEDDAETVPVMQDMPVPQNMMDMQAEAAPQQAGQEHLTAAEAPAAVNADDAAARVQAGRADMPQVHTQQNGEAADNAETVKDADVAEDARADARAATAAGRMQETAARTADTDAKAAPAAETAVTDDGEAPATETVRKDAMDRYRRADGKNEQRSFAARVSEQIRNQAPQNPQGQAQAAPAGTAEDAGRKEGADISLLKDDITGKVEMNRRAEGFAVPRPQQQAVAPAESGEAQPKAPVNNSTDESAMAFQRMQVLGTAPVNETERTEMTRATVEEPARVMNQIIRSAEVMVKEGRTEMTIELQPRHLGEVRINVVMDNDVLTARIHAKSEAVGDMIRLNLAQLGDSLKDMGFDVSHFDVSSGSDYDQAGQHGGQTEERNGQPVFTDAMKEFLDTVEPAVPEPYRFGRASAGQYAFEAVA